MPIGILDLVAADEENQPMTPVGFDRSAADAAFASLVRDVLNEFPRSMSESRRDAPFHGQIGVEVRPALAIVRASNFGRLITIFPIVGLLPADVIQRLKQLFKQHHYVFVESTVLQSVYGGVCHGDFKTWVDRFFGST